MPGDLRRNWTDLPRDDADLLAALVQSSYDAIYSKDEKAVITSWNPAAQRLYGYTPEEAIGQPISMLVPLDRRGEEIDILNEILAGNRVEHYETRRVRKDGALVDVSVSVSPVHDADGRVVEAAVIARDISERVRLEAQLARAQRMEALELNDTVVQGLVASKMAFEMSDHERGLRAITETLEKAKAIVTRLLEASGDVAPGDLVRSEPAEIDPDR